MEFSYKLFQIKKEMTRDFGFENLSALQDRGLIEPYHEMATIPHSHAYMKTYEGNIEADSVHGACNKLFTKFNMEHPRDFSHYSMSVGDIIEIDGKYMFVDSFDFEEVKINL